MKYPFPLFILLIYSLRSYSAFDTYETMYKVKVHLQDGKEITGFYYHFNYDTIPTYTYTHEGFLTFLKIVNPPPRDTIEIYGNLNNFTLPSSRGGIDKYSAVLKKDLYRIALNDVKRTTFIYGCNCDKSPKNCLVIKELNESELDKLQKGEVTILHGVADPDSELYPEAGMYHMVLGKPGSITSSGFETKIKNVYKKRKEDHEFVMSRYLQLKEELRERGIIVITLYETEYTISGLTIGS